ncbi:hypothetical protein ACVMHZ_003725 [Bradyrhizobium liaoningense]
MTAQIFLNIHLSATVDMQQRPLIWGPRFMRAAAAILITLLLAGCAGNEAPVQQPSMYTDMAVPGSKLDAQAAAVMISQYRQNNGLGTVVIDPDLMRLAESQSGAMAAANKMDHDVRAPLAKRLATGGYPATVAVENVSAGLSYAGGSVLRLARLAASPRQHAQGRCHKIRHRGELCSRHQIQGVLDHDPGLDGVPISQT